jgi:uncharacterized protein YndB with AHSA1/START domain
MSRNKIEPSQEPELFITRIFNAPRELIFNIWTDPNHVVHWWGPLGFTAPFCNADIQKGGSFLYCMQSPEGKQYWSKGIYHEIIISKKIVSTMYFSDKKGNIVEPTQYGFGPEFPSEMLDIVTFEDHDGNKTKFTLHRNTPILISKHYMMDQGWNQSLDRFEQYLEKIK